LGIRDWFRRKDEAVISAVASGATSIQGAAESKMVAFVKSLPYDVSIAKKFDHAEDEVDAAIKGLKTLMERQTWSRHRQELIKYCREERQKRGLQP
jgi:hypothetical protein